MQGYNTKEPCVICGKLKNNKIEPRFGYIVCEDHYNVKPVNIHKERENYIKKKEGRNES